MQKVQTRDRYEDKDVSCRGLQDEWRNHDPHLLESRANRAANAGGGVETCPCNLGDSLSLWKTAKKDEETACGVVA
jgi:hypothetical protein